MNAPVRPEVGLDGGEQVGQALGAPDVQLVAHDGQGGKHAVHVGVGARLQHARLVHHVRQLVQQVQARVVRHDAAVDQVGQHQQLGMTLLIGRRGLSHKSTHDAQHRLEAVRGQTLVQLLHQRLQDLKRESSSSNIINHAAQPGPPRRRTRSSWR